MNPKILVSMDSNEQGSDRAKALGMLLAEDAGYQWAGFQELPVDMRMHIKAQCPNQCDFVQNMRCKDTPGKLLYCSHFEREKSVNIELKEISDFWSSKNTGHLGAQIMAMIAEGRPGFVAVFGRLDEVLQEVPTKKANKRRDLNWSKTVDRTDAEMETDRNTARALSADAIACNVPIVFLSTNYERSFKWILSHAKSILTGPNMASWLPRFSCDPQGYQVLCSINGIGDVAAKGLLHAYGGISQIANECKHNPDALASCKMGNGKALGKAKAARLIEVFG